MRRDRLVSEVLGGKTAITPSDLYNTAFGKSVLGGYSKREVDPFLRRVGDMLETLMNQVRELKQQCGHQKDQLEALHEMESTLRTALVSSQRFHEDMIDKAKREARAIVEEGRAIKERVRAEAERLPKAIEDEIEALMRVRDGLRHDLAIFLDTQRAFLDAMPATENFKLPIRDAAGESSQSEARADAFLESIATSPPDSAPAAPPESLAPTANISPRASSYLAEAKGGEEPAEQLELAADSYTPSSLGPLPASPIERNGGALSLDKEPWLEDGGGHAEKGKGS